MATGTDAITKSPFGMRHFIAAAAGTCAANATWWMQPVLMHDLAVVRGLGEAGAGLVVSAEMAAMSLGSAALMRFCHPGKLAMPALLGLLLAIVGSFISFGVHGVPGLILARVAVGFGVGGSLMMSNAVAAGFPDPDKAFARLGVINLVFGAILVAVVPTVHQFAVSNASYLTILLFLVIMLPGVMVLPRLIRVEDHGHHETAGELDARSRRNILLLTFATFAIGVASGTMWAFYGLIGQQAGMSGPAIDTAISVAIFSAIGGAGLAALLGGRLGRVIPTGAALMLMSIAIMTLSFGPTPTLFRIMTCVNISCLYFIVPYLLGAGSAQDPNGRGAAYVGSAFFFTGAVSPALGGILSETIGLHIVGMAVVLIALIVIAILAFVERKPKPGAMPTIAPTPVQALTEFNS